MQTNTTAYSTAAANSQPPTLNPFPYEGKVRAKQIAQHLGIGVSTWWLYAKQGRVKPPMKFGARVSVWDAAYIRELAVSGIPELNQGKKK